MVQDNNYKDNSYFVKILRGYLHDVPKHLGPDHNEYYFAFLKSFAFWKFYLLLLLLIIGFINISNKKPVDEEIKNNTGIWILEYILLFLAFFVSCIFMYIIRDPSKAKDNILNWSMIKTIITLLIMSFIKHLDFQLSGMYRYFFSSKKCLKYKEHLTTLIKSDEATKEEEKTQCKCDDSMFNGPLWDGLGWFGLVFAFILFVFIILIIIFPNIMETLFNITENNFNYVLKIVSLVIIFFTFIFGSFNINLQKNKKCSSGKNSILEQMKDGGACVTIVFTIIITFLPVYILYKWNSHTKNELVLPYSYSYPRPNNEYIKMHWFRRAFIVTVEILFTYIIFTITEAIIESFRKEEDLSHILKSEVFWINSLKTLAGVAYIQIILEYSGWFHQHLFNDLKKNA
jgi:hypothetical protein